MIVRFVSNLIFYLPKNYILHFYSIHKNNFICFLQMIIGFVSNLIVFPPIILIVYLFKKSKPLKKRKNRLDLGLEQGKHRRGPILSNKLELLSIEGSTIKPIIFEPALVENLHVPPFYVLLDVRIT
jgi:hypothetical protein